MPTPTRLYADTLLPDGGTARFISERRARGGRAGSWRRIALELRDATGGKIDIAPETVRKWATEPAETAA